MDQFSPEEQAQAQAMQQEMMMHQQREVFQAAILKLTDSCFSKCVTTISAGKLSYKETECVKSCAARYLDTTTFLVKKLSNSSMDH